MEVQADTGWIGIGPENGTFVSDDQAFEYALERALHGDKEETKEFKEILVDWYYSGNWIRTE